MTTISKPVNSMSKVARDAIIDQLRACHTSEEILKFENWFNSQTELGPLHKIICDFLRDRDISRGLAAKWLCVLLNDRDRGV